VNEKKPLYESPEEKGKRGFEDLECYQAQVLGYINQPDFDSVYNLIRQTEKALNGFMSYVRRQRAGSQDDGDKRIREGQIDYDVSLLLDEESD